MTPPSDPTGDPTADPTVDAAGSATAVADVTVVGAGVVGTAIARELVRHDLRVVLVDAAADVGTGTSKANTAIWHTGFDAKPGTLEARLVARGHRLLAERAEATGWPLQPTGAVLVAWDDEQAGRLPAIRANAVEVGYTAIVELTADEVYQREPHLGPGVVAGLLVPDEGLLDPWSITLSNATDAVVNGADLRLSCRVTRIVVDVDSTRVTTTRGTIRTRWLVNAAGLGSDLIDHMLGHDDYTITPRRGELVVFDKLARPLLQHIVLPVPTATTKGVLVSPTVFGNILLGPTADDIDDRTATGTTRDGLHRLLAAGRRILPALDDYEVTATYAGLRAATQHADYRYDVVSDQRYVRVGGIRSTGVSAALAIAEQVRDDLAAAGVGLHERPDFVTVRLPSLAENDERPYRDEDRIAADPEYGRIVCFCERVSAGEIRDAFTAAVPPHDLDGLRRRTRVLMGRCQGFFCGAPVNRLLADANQVPRGART
jgi:glycerol-3-phosphate dehydrogenase